jgi:hypothetical protein
MESQSLPTSQISGRMYSTIPLFQLSVWCEKCVAAQHYSVIGKQLLFANKRNRVRGAVLYLSQDGACTSLFENFSENILKGDQSNKTTDNPPLFSLVNTCNMYMSKSGSNVPSSNVPAFLDSGIIEQGNNKLGRADVPAPVMYITSRWVHW